MFDIWIKRGKCMPRKKSSKLPLILVLIIIGAAGFLAYHDGLIGTTSMRDINQGDIAEGTAVSVKGEINYVSGFGVTVVTIVDSNDNFVVFSYDGTLPPQNSIVVARGIVDGPYSLRDVTSIDAVWVFQ
ncbi:MAG: hypothetical protein BAJATHORv1_40008 [Candidatus Thorarchaeota archaeon]|nr:MAG: hypothetical protein BAJATHORv1_40008 [Candidatus Thorarchaeota archaeon]